MRVTNQMLSNNFLRDMRTNLSNLSTIQNQMASGKQINKPSDDPAKASKIMQMYSEIDANKQYNSNIKNTANWLDVTDTTLDHIGKVIGRIDELLVSTGGSASDPNSRKAIKDEINQRVQELSQLINTSFDGKYIFGGTDGASKPVGTNTVDGNSELVSNAKLKVVAELTNLNAYGGATVAAGTKFDISLNGVAMEVTTTAEITSGGTMVVTAKTIEDSINNAITTANGAKLLGEAGYIELAKVTRTTDGRFEINSPSGAITFSDTTETKELGLRPGPDMLLVEVSQGVTMDYNITASQVLNYGTGAGENLMKLLEGITSHLDSTKPEDIKSLTNGDLKGIQDVMTNVLKLRSEVGAKQNRMESAESRNTDQNLNMTEILSATEDIDITETAMQYATMQTIYMASLQTSAKVLQPSLLDYLR
ncbi:flagellar hook-associated protein FlgL [Clostridium bowmanii]|uniref:flagellar hook-associated protein FlgL n=1 Tax=Clostridium bowmanii TaxID=132925 RepID=UPI001C0BBC7D|nr:flagellar hook-associated protein FlgL [Clostridium bowmanii]MBU3190712.1 flagellar hook-associated protein FlgL [Clostridium bowmanii]MCA1075042.1 flagellar hook-associated protein FlgL [Clostridium bowmanii]